MFKKQRKAAAGLALAACLLLAGCAPAARTAAPPQPTLEELLDEVNAAHQAVEKEPGRGWVMAHLRDPAEKRTAEERAAYLPKEAKEYDPERELTAEQAAADVEWLFSALRDGYPLYGYFGGAAAFDAAEQSALAAVNADGTLACGELQDILLEALSFVKDGHFSVNGLGTAPKKLPFFFRETAFYKTEDGYRTADGRTVASVDGYPDLEDLFRRSISPEGEIVYYPILLQDGAYKISDVLEKTAWLCSETLTVRYTDGSAAELTAEPYQFYCDEDAPAVSSRQDGEIPVFQFNGFRADVRDEILEGAALLSRAPVSILDLRMNGGGDANLAVAWMRQYAGAQVPPNRYVFDIFTGEEPFGSRDRWVSNENILIILTEKFSASASEFTLDMAHNLENCLIIGENSNGSLLTALSKFQLPNSGCVVHANLVSDLVFLDPDGSDYFEELRGFYPDFWVPAAEAEELAVKLMQRLGG